MQKKRVLAGVAGLVLMVAGAGCSDDGGDAASDPTPSATSSPATASPTEAESPAGPAYFETVVTPATGVTTGTVLTATGTGATASTDYFCLVAVYDTDGGGVSAPLESSLTPVTSDADGAVTCELGYEPFAAEDDEGVTRHCPTTAADRADGFSCGVVLADAATLGAASASAASFTPAR